MQAKAAKTGRIIRIAALGCIISLIIFATILVIYMRVAHKADHHHTELLHLNADSLAQTAQDIHLIKSASFLGNQSADSLEAFAKNIQEIARKHRLITVAAVAAYQLDETKVQLRQALSAPSLPTEQVNTIEKVATALAEKIEKRADFTDESLWPVSKAFPANQKFPVWAVWHIPQTGQLFAALLNLETTAPSALSLAFGNHPDAARSVSIPFMNAPLSLTYNTPGFGWSYLTFETMLPPVFLAMMLLSAFGIYAQDDRAHARKLDRRHKQTIRNIAAKQRELEDSEERFNHLAATTNVIPWTVDLDNQRFTYIGAQIEGLTGYAPDVWQAHGFWPQHIHPEDRNHVIKQSIEETIDGQYTTLHYRIRAANGKVIHIRNMLTTETRAGVGFNGRPQKIAHGFMLDVTELRQAAAALDVARRKAVEANRVKSEFLANMSHELRTPLNAVIGFSEIMKEQIFGPLDERYREYAESVHASGKHLLELINDVLDLSKIEAGRIELVEEECDVGGLLKECRTLLLERIATAGLHETLEIDPKLPRVLIDDRRIKQVILNLMSNAIKFTPPGGSIALSALFYPGRGICVAVRDSGVGMAPEEIPRALSKFGQIDGELARKHDGTGLGLPIAKSLIEMHGGEFEIWSEKGKGTEMRLWLPQSRVISGFGGKRQHH